MTAEMAINNVPIEGTKYSPFELNLGHHPCLGPDVFWETKPWMGHCQLAEAWMKQMQADWQLARRILVKVKAGQMSRANRNRQPANFHVGDLVMVRVFPVNRSQLAPNGPFADWWAGPYRVCGKVSHDSFSLELPLKASSCMGRVFNAIGLKPYYSRTADSAAQAFINVDDNKSLAGDFASSDGAELEEPDTTEAPTPASPRWQQQMSDQPVEPVEPTAADLARQWPKPHQ